MIIKVLAATAALAMLAAGSAKAQDGTPPYGSSAYAYGAPSCSGFTIAGGYAGVTLLGIDFGVSGRARFNGGCHGSGGGAAYAPPVAAPISGGGYYGQPAYAMPAAYPQQGYGGYAPPPCGCQGAPMGYRPY